jgi:hypothetical protein
LAKEKKNEARMADKKIDFMCVDLAAVIQSMCQQLSKSNNLLLSGILK